MAVLPAQDRARVSAQYQRSASLGSVAFGKLALAAAVAAVDGWVEANQAAFNAALPVGFRTTATPEQKSLLLAYVVMRRVGLLRAEED